MTALPPLNPPPSNLAPSQQNQRHKPLRMVIGNGDNQIAYLPYQTVYKPIVLICDNDGTSVTLEVTASSNDILNGLVEDTDPIWKTVAFTAGHVILSAQYTAIKISNASGAERSIDIL